MKCTGMRGLQLRSCLWTPGAAGSTLRETDPRLTPFLGFWMEDALESAVCPWRCIRLKWLGAQKVDSCTFLGLAAPCSTSGSDQDPPRELNPKVDLRLWGLSEREPSQLSNTGWYFHSPSGTLVGLSFGAPPEVSWECEGRLGSGPELPPVYFHMLLQWATTPSASPHPGTLSRTVLSGRPKHA